jgi:host factor-I protein
MSAAPARSHEPLDTSLPSVRNLQGFVRDKKPVELKLLTGDIFKGTLNWIDPDCLCLQNGSGEVLLVWRQALAYVKAV